MLGRVGWVVSAPVHCGRAFGAGWVRLVSSAIGFCWNGVDSLGQVVVGEGVGVCSLAKEFLARQNAIFLLLSLLSLSRRSSHVPSCCRSTELGLRQSVTIEVGSEVNRSLTYWLSQASFSRHLQRSRESVHFGFSITIMLNAMSTREF